VTYPGFHFFLGGGGAYKFNSGYIFTPVENLSQFLLAFPMWYNA